MAFLGALSSAVGILNSIQQNNAARRQQALANQQQAEALRQQQAYIDSLQRQYQNNVASGAYNPDAINNLYRQTFQNALRNNLNDANVSLTNAGARAGDSSLNVANQNIAENNALALTQAIQNATTQAQQRQMQDLSMTNPAQYTNMLNNASNTNWQRGYQSQVDPSGLLAMAGNPKLWEWMNANNTSNVVKNKYSSPAGPPDPTSDGLSGISDFMKNIRFGAMG